MSTSQLILRITPLTFSSHPLHLSFLLRYHALLSTSPTFTSSWLPSKLTPLSAHPLQHTLFIKRAPLTVQPLSKIFSTPNSFSILPLPLKTSYPTTIRHYLISSTFMSHSSPNTLLTPITPGSPRTFKHLKPFAGISSMYTSAPLTPHLEPKPSPISNQSLIDTINLSLLPSRNTTLHSFPPALPTLDTSGEQSTLFSIANLPIHSLAPFHPQCPICRGLRGLDPLASFFDSPASSFWPTPGVSA